MLRLLSWTRRRVTSGWSPNPRNAFCSFCQRSHADVGPLAEGPGLVFICEKCVSVCGRLIADEQIRRVAVGLGSAEQPTLM